MRTKIVALFCALIFLIACGIPAVGLAQGPGTFTLGIELSEEGPLKANDEVTVTAKINIDGANDIGTITALALTYDSEKLSLVKDSYSYALSQGSDTSNLNQEGTILVSATTTLGGLGIKKNCFFCNVQSKRRGKRSG